MFLLYIAKFLRQRNISDYNSNKISQIDSFGKTTITFILALYKSGWNKLNITNKTPLQNKIKCNDKPS